MIGSVESLWRYPVKSMRGEELDEVFVGFGGLEGDRLFAFHSSAAPANFPYFTARQKAEMLHYVPRIRPNEQLVDVRTPRGETLAIDDPRLLARLRDGVDAQHELSLMRSDRALADAHPVSLISLQTIRTLCDESGIAPEKRRFRASIYLDLAEGSEDDFVGRAVRIGRDLVVHVVKRDARCIVINIDPDTLALAPAVLKTVARVHGGTAGVYGDVVHEGLVRKGDAVAFA